ncbi:uncharacterized protein LOC107802655 [Nicotiana tabacum]|uniref:Uncharacterized protein LOC107802655 n=1 Tax=Nicotiana tabacum TaxID=4097 RepID=A0A1S4AYB5_TOBAC|nr:PREDICTED: VAN3-binding protein-like [Nicotiana tabacum]
MAQHNSLSYNNEKSKNTLLTSNRSCLEPLKSPFSSYSQSPEIPGSPTYAMEFLCRSWSPSSNNLLQMFSSSNPFLRDTGGIEDHEGKEEETHEDVTSRVITNKEDIKLDLHHMKEWFKSKPLGKFFRSHQEKKERLRLQTAQLHAALSLTQLASAIAGFASSSSSEAQEWYHINSETGGEWSHGTGSVVASAAALMTTVCAEAAESLGAGRAKVASAVNSGLAIRTPMDMIAVTATAATCLRGAAILKSRAKTDPFPRIPDFLTVGTRIWIIMPSGRKEDKWMTLHSKQNQLVLSLKRKYFGALRTSKEYKLINITKESPEAQYNYLLSLKTNNGIIKLLFEDEKQSCMWMSTISSLLKM